MNLMQNCDLPPPMKVFIGSDNKTAVSSMKQLNIDKEFVDDHEKLELLKALRLSQTRAREAEKKAEALAKERDSLSAALLREANILFAHRLWLRLLHLQVSLQKESHHHRDRDRDRVVCTNQDVAFALCFGIAGFAFGWRFLF